MLRWLAMDTSTETPDMSTSESQVSYERVGLVADEGALRTGRSEAVEFALCRDVCSCQTFLRCIWLSRHAVTPAVARGPGPPPDYKSAASKTALALCTAKIGKNA